MALRKEHEIHTRRFSRNFGLGLVLAAVVALFFGLTIVKVGNQDTPGAAETSGEAQ